MSDPNQADLRVLDGFNPHEPLLEFLAGNGVTVVHAMPGRANVIAGQTGIFRTDGPHGRRACRCRPAAHARQPRRGAEGGVPGQAARHAHGRPPAWCARRSPRPRRTQEAKPPRTAQATPSTRRWLPALEGKMPVFFAAHRADDIATALRHRRRSSS